MEIRKNDTKNISLIVGKDRRWDFGNVGGPEGHARRKREGREVKDLNGWVEGETGENNT